MELVDLIANEVWIDCYYQPHMTYKNLLWFIDQDYTNSDYQNTNY